MNLQYIFLFLSIKKLYETTGELTEEKNENKKEQKESAEKSH